MSNESPEVSQKSSSKPIEVLSVVVQEKSRQLKDVLSSKIVFRFDTDAYEQLVRES